MQTKGEDGNLIDELIGVGGREREMGMVVVVVVVGDGVEGVVKHTRYKDN